jgi:hypothetical protein
MKERGEVEGEEMRVVKVSCDLRQFNHRQNTRYHCQIQ